MLNPHVFTGDLRFLFVSDVIDQQRYTNRLITNVVYIYRSLQVVEFQ